jgi:hypothetical protein
MHFRLHRLSVNCQSAIEKLARPAGLEPATLGLEGRCSIQLSYGRSESSILPPVLTQSARREDLRIAVDMAFTCATVARYVNARNFR